MSKIIVFEEDAKNKILCGVDKLARVVGLTMGPRGKNVIIQKFVGSPIITKDGVSVAREVVLEDPIEELACKLVKEVAGRTATVAGDGTTTSTILADEILKCSNSTLSGEVTPIDFREGIEWSKDYILKHIDDFALKTPEDKDIINIATISANNDVELGRCIGEAYIWAGKDGTVGAEALPGGKTHLKRVDGVTLKSGYSNPNFLHKKGDTEVILENCKILIVNRKITHLSDCYKMLNEIHKDNFSLLILSRGVQKEALNSLIDNNKKGMLSVCCVNIPNSFDNDDWVDNLGIITGAKVAGERMGIPLSSLSIDDLGHSERVIVGRFSSQFFNPSINNDLRIEKVSAYKEDISQIIGDEIRAELKKRVAFLSTKASIVRVGYSTELELREKGDRVEDAMHATYAAMSDGIVVGGGTALLRASDSLRKADIPNQNWKLAAKIIADACTRPIRQILKNSGIEPEGVIAKILSNDDNSYGYNVVSGKVENLFESGIVDPLKVTKTALVNAVSVALLLINTDAILAEKPDDPSGWQPKPDWRPPTGTLNHSH